MKLLQLSNFQKISRVQKFEKFCWCKLSQMTSTLRFRRYKLCRTTKNSRKFVPAKLPTFKVLLFSGHKHEQMFASSSDETVWKEKAVKLLGILIDSNLMFNDHLKIICKKASQKLIAISRFFHILSEDKRIILLKTFYESQFNYCPLI